MQFCVSRGDEHSLPPNASQPMSGQQYFLFIMYLTALPIGICRVQIIDILPAVNHFRIYSA